MMKLVNAFHWGWLLFSQRLLNRESSFWCDQLIIKLDAIGDFYIWLPYAKASFERSKERGEKQVFLINDLWKELFRKEIPEAEFIALNKKELSSYRYKKMILKKLPQAQVVISPTYSLDVTSGFISVLPLTQRRIGMLGDNTNMKSVCRTFFNVFFDELIRVGNTQNHEILKNEIFYYSLGVNLERKMEFREKEDFIMIHVGASWNYRRWPVDKVNKLISKLLQKSKQRIVVIGGPSDKDLKEQILVNERVENLIGETSLVELRELIMQAKVIISNETSISHMAHYFNKKAFTILGGGHFSRFLPYPKQLNSTVLSLYEKMNCFSCNWKCIYPLEGLSSVPCIDNISVQTVLEEVSQCL